MPKTDRPAPEMVRIKIRPEIAAELYVEAARRRVFPRDVVETALLAEFERAVEKPRDRRAAAR